MCWMAGVVRKYCSRFTYSPKVIIVDCLFHTGPKLFMLIQTFHGATRIPLTAGRNSGPFHFYEGKTMASYSERERERERERVKAQGRQKNYFIITCLIT